MSGVKYPLLCLLVLLLIAVHVSAYQDGTTVEPYSPQHGPTDTSGADRTVTFFELPLWIQLYILSGYFVSLILLARFLPFILGKAKVFLQNKNRTALLEYIRNNPGCTPADLSNVTGINRGTVRYHLTILAMMRKIVEVHNLNSRVYFENSGKFTEFEKRMHRHLRNSTTKKILGILVSSPGVSRKEIGERIGIAGPSVTWHTNRLSRSGILAIEKTGRGIRYVLTKEASAFFRDFPGNSPAEIPGSD